jgi:DNA polymerase-3 subunit gamma/tau
VQELDAASSNSVDDVRELRERLRFRPAQGRFKVIILDEVPHAQRRAFNALLKTLEEPPPDVKFMLATTELRKVPTTILSRCQTFHLRACRRRCCGRTSRASAGGGGGEEERCHGGARADGSVRDGLSISTRRSPAGGGGPGGAVRDMLGCRPRPGVADESGDAATPPAALHDGARTSAAPIPPWCCDLLELTHLLSRSAPSALRATRLPRAERARGRAGGRSPSPCSHAPGRCC